MSYLLIADKPDVLILDDQPENLHILTDLLANDFRVHPFSDDSKFLAYIASGKPADLILLDVIMPNRDGYEICAILRKNRELEHVPIVFLTSLTSAEDERKGLDLGANDYIGKPFSPGLVLARAKHHVELGRTLRIIADQNANLDHKVRERTAELEQANADLKRKSEELERAQDATIIAFSTLAESRDNETGMHLRRTQNYVRELASALSRSHPRFRQQLDDETIALLYKSAPLHDIGKVAIPDNILLKPGKLTVEEFEIMKTHATCGRDAIVAAEKGVGGSSSFLRCAHEIAYGHHEKWNGSGYPQGLCGESIPLSARIMAVADVYDALISTRVYKAGMPHEKAVAIIREGRGSHFDPDICDQFLLIQDEFARIAEQFSDEVVLP